MLLKGQMAHLPAAPGTQVREGWAGPKQNRGEAFGEPQKAATSASCGILLPSTGPTYCPLSTLFGVGQVSREAVALVKPVTSAPKTAAGPTPGERGGKRDEQAGVLVYESVCECR